MHGGQGDDLLANDGLQQKGMSGRKVTTSERARKRDFPKYRRRKELQKKTLLTRIAPGCTEDTKHLGRNIFGVVVKMRLTGSTGRGRGRGEQSSLRELNCKGEQRSRLEPVSKTFPRPSLPFHPSLSSLLFLLYFLPILCPFLLLLGNLPPGWSALNKNPTAELDC